MYVHNVQSTRSRFALVTKKKQAISLQVLKQEIEDPNALQDRCFAK